MLWFSQPTWMCPYSMKYFRVFLKLVSVVMSEVDCIGKIV